MAPRAGLEPTTK